MERSVERPGTQSLLTVLQEACTSTLSVQGLGVVVSKPGRGLPRSFCANEPTLGPSHTLAFWSIGLVGTALCNSFTFQRDGWAQARTTLSLPRWSQVSSA